MIPLIRTIENQDNYKVEIPSVAPRIEQQNQLPPVLRKNKRCYPQKQGGGK